MLTTLQLETFIGFEEGVVYCVPPSEILIRFLVKDMVWGAQGFL
jgi:hypothetical protein